MHTGTSPPPPLPQELAGKLPKPICEQIRANVKESAGLIARPVAHQSTALLWIGYLQILFYEFHPLDVSYFHAVKGGMGTSCANLWNFLGCCWELEPRLPLCGMTVSTGLPWVLLSVTRVWEEIHGVEQWYLTPQQLVILSPGTVSAVMLWQPKKWLLLSPY